jgi:hypothetical protein
VQAAQRTVTADQEIVGATAIDGVTGSDTPPEE